MKKNRTIIGMILLGVTSTCAIALLASRQLAIHKADAIMQPTLTHGWFRFEARPILWVGNEVSPRWLVRYTHRQDVVDFPPDVQVSLGGRVISTTASNLLKNIAAKENSVEPPPAPRTRSPERQTEP